MITYDIKDVYVNIPIKETTEITTISHSKTRYTNPKKERPWDLLFQVK
jgi:hypothetical protein